MFTHGRGPVDAGIRLMPGRDGIPFAVGDPRVSKVKLRAVVELSIFILNETNSQEPGKLWSLGTRQQNLPAELTLVPPGFDISNASLHRLVARGMALLLCNRVSISGLLR